MINKRISYENSLQKEPEVGAIFPKRSEVISGSLIEELPHFTRQSTGALDIT
jgi:hypothetical protein